MPVPVAAPLDERLFLARGRVKLGLGKLSGACKDLERCLELSGNRSEVRAAAYFDLARLFATEGHETECYNALVAWSEIDNLGRQYIEMFPEFSPFFESDWFTSLFTAGHQPSE
jgi:hypothetical protein